MGCYSRLIRFTTNPLLLFTSHGLGGNTPFLIWIVCNHKGSHLEFAAGLKSPVTALIEFGGDTRIGKIMDTAIMPAIR